MPSRNDHNTSYSKNLDACTFYKGPHQEIAATAATAEQSDEDWLNGLDMTPVAETDDEILSGIDDFVVDHEEPVVEVHTDASVVISANPVVIPAKVNASPAADWSVRLPEIVKSVKAKRTVNVYRDASFMRDLQGLLARRDAGTLDPSSVSRLPLLTYTLDHTIFDRSSRHPPWWLFLNGGVPHPKPMRQFKTPAEWRDVSDTLHIHYLHLGLKTLGPVHGFTLLLDDSVEAQARSKPDALGWLTARIARRLKESLGRPVQFYCVLEEDDKRRLHVHGEINAVGPDSTFPPADLAKARTALRAAGGEWPDFRQFQALVPGESPDAGWAGYLAKDFAFFGPVVREMLTVYGSSYAPGFKGDQVSRTKLLGEIAGKIYGEHRALVMGARK